MKSETGRPGAVAFLFPGQGSTEFRRLTELDGHSAFHTRYRLVCDLLGFDPLTAAARDAKVFKGNAVSSLLTVMASSLLLDRQESEPKAVAGYSVGQWTALYAAGALKVETLFQVVHARAGFMDRCMPADTGMIGMIGVKEADLARICEEARSRGLQVEIANFNAPLHYSLSGSGDGLAYVEQEARALKPKVMARLPVAGAWHGSFLKAAVPLFRRYLDGVAIGATKIPVIDNVSGMWLPVEEAARKDRLAAHLELPVRWADGVKALAAAGIDTFIEVGIGNTLTRYGFFIERKARHVASFGGAVK